MTHLSTHITKKTVIFMTSIMNITFAFRYSEGILKYHVIKAM